jgi:glycogen synthase
MRILYWTGLFWPHIGGAELIGTQLIPAMQARGYEFAVVTSQSSAGLSERSDYQGAAIYRFPFHESLANHDLKALTRTRRAIAELKAAFNPDLVHLNSIDASVFFHLLTEGGVPTLFTVHSLPPSNIDDGTLLKKLLASSRWVTTASEFMLAAVREAGGGAVTPRSSMIYYGLKTPRLELSPLPFDQPLLLCLGRIVKEKGFDLALEAFAATHDSLPQARLVVAGDGPARAELEQQALRLGIAEAVNFAGWISPDRVPELINAATAVIVPSRWQEPFGLVALQAAQMARPVIAARVGGLPEIVEDEKTGLLFDKDDSRALSRQIDFLLRRPEAAARMGRLARKKAAALFGFEPFVNAYDSLYRRIIRPSTDLPASPGQRVRDAARPGRAGLGVRASYAKPFTCGE